MGVEMDGDGGVGDERRGESGCGAGAAGEERWRGPLGGGGLPPSSQHSSPNSFLASSLVSVLFGRRITVWKFEDFRFYVKSTLENLEVLQLPFCS